MGADTYERLVVVATSSDDDLQTLSCLSRLSRFMLFIILMLTAGVIAGSAIIAVSMLKINDISQEYEAFDRYINEMPDIALNSWLKENHLVVSNASEYVVFNDNHTNSDNNNNNNIRLTVVQRECLQRYFNMAMVYDYVPIDMQSWSSRIIRSNDTTDNNKTRMLDDVLNASLVKKYATLVRNKAHWYQYVSHRRNMFARAIADQQMHIMLSVIFGFLPPIGIGVFVCTVYYDRRRGDNNNNDNDNDMHK